MASVAQVRANRLNAQKSTGPRTPEGKAVVARNAVKHGLLAEQVVIRGEDPGEFELFRDRMVQDLDPAGSLEGLLAERVAHLGWRLRRAERLENAAWATLEADFLAKASGVGRPEGQRADDEEAVLARVVVKDFGNAKVLDRLLGYERRIENSLYRTMGELRKCRRLRESEPAEEPGAPAGSGVGGGVCEGVKCEVSSSKQEEGRRPDSELQTANFTLQTSEIASGDATTNVASADLSHPSSIPSFQCSSLYPSGETKPISGRLEEVPVPRDSEAAKREELGRGRPSYEETPDGVTTNTEASYDATTNGVSVDPPASNLTLETSNSAAGRSCQTKPIEVSSVKCEVSSEGSQAAGKPG